jgi:anti-sigma B factor antagonist
MRFEENKVGNVLVARVLDARIAADFAPRLKAHLSDYVSNGNRFIVLDLGSVSFIDSSGLGALVSCLKTMGRDGNLVVSGAHGAVATMFKLTRLDRVFRMYASNDLAVAALS